MRSPAPADQPVRRLVNPYPWRDYVRVVKRNLAQRPVAHHSDLTDFIGPDGVVDPTVEPAATIGFLGDLMPVRGRRFVLSDALAEHLRACSHLVVNFEGVLWPAAAPPPKVIAAQRHPDLHVLEALAAVVPPERIIVSVANNHTADFGYEPHRHTVEAIEALGMPVIGTVERPRTRIADRINVAAVTQWTNQPHTYLPFLADHADHLDPDAAFQLLVPHWGLEMETHPRPATIELGRRLLGDWDAVVGHHPHVPNPVAVEQIGGHDRLIAYSLGQGASDIRYPIYRSGIVLRLGIGPSAGATTGAPWRVGPVSWRFLSLSRRDPTAIRAELRGTNRFFPGLTAPVE